MSTSSEIVRAGYTVRGAAREVGCSESTLRRAIEDGLVQAEREGARVTISYETVLELRTGGVKRKRPPSLAHREMDRTRGENAQKVFDRFARGMSLTDVVRDLAIDPIDVSRFWDQWSLMRAKEKSIEKERCLRAGPNCSEGFLGSVRVCAHHAPRLRELTDEEIAVLAEHHRKKRVAK